MIAPHWLRTIIAALLLVCAGASHAQADNDPIERWNRAVFGFNEGLDSAVLKPVAEGYKAVVPELVRTGVKNFFGNIEDGWSAINQLLQGKATASVQMTMRVATNTLFGIGGLLDFATELGIERLPEDFGQTLGRWGLPAGLYIVWPLLGPSSLRDSAGLPLDLAWSSSGLTNDDATRVGLRSLELVDVRARLLNASNLLDDIALDKYVFIRESYFARRRSKVYDGDPPELPQADDEPPTEAK